jgi:hypothetical protein
MTFFSFDHFLQSAAAKAAERLLQGRADPIQWASDSEDIRVWSLMIGEFFCRAVEKCPKAFKGDLRTFDLLSLSSFDFIFQLLSLVF